MDQAMRPIGIFDSGLGGLSVVHSIQQLMPNEAILYYGDSANAPYGNRSTEQVRRFSHQIVKRLIAHDVKAIVIACNTATSAAAEMLRASYDLPIIGMEPALKPAVDAYPNGRIAVLGTAVTLREKKFKALLNRQRTAANIRLYASASLVELVEGARYAQQEVDAILNALIDERARSVDAVVLGCTHFVFLKRYIARYFEGAVLFDGNFGTANHLKRRLSERKLLTTRQSQGALEMLNSAGQDKIKQSYHMLERNYD